MPRGKTTKQKRKRSIGHPVRSLKRLRTMMAGVNPDTGHAKSHTPTDASRAEALRLAKMGATVEEVAVIMDIRPGHVRRDYGPMIDRELALHTLEIEEAVAKAAKGVFTHPDVHISVVGTGRGEARIVKTMLTKHYPPSAAHAQFWLKNRQPAHRVPGAWEDHSESKPVGPDEGAALIRERLKEMQRTGGLKK